MYSFGYGDFAYKNIALYGYLICHILVYHDKGILEYCNIGRKKP